MKPRILVLMATYNGEKYVKEQLLSILNQKGVDVTIFINDDGSSDNTYDILKKICKRYKNIRLMQHKCGSAIKNFYFLINNCDEDYDYYALSDQDDYWLEDKLISAIKKIETMDSESDAPILYSGESTLVDENLKKINKRPTKHYLVDTFSSSLVCCATQGCTFVFNKKLLVEIKNKTSSTKLMHDAWIHRTCLLIGGKIIYDNESHMLYRQHQNNVFSTLGKRQNFIKKVFNKIKSIFSKDNYDLCTNIIEEWEKNFENEMTSDSREIISKIKSSKKNLTLRIKIIFSKSFCSRYFLAKIKFDYLILIGKI